MLRIVKILAVAAVAFASARTVGLTGAPNLVPPADRNGALKYWAAFIGIDRALADRIRDVDWKAVGSAATPEALPESFRAASEAIPEWVVNFLLHASSHERCDFEVEYEKGIQALMPHLGPARNSGRLLKVDARAKLAAGNVQGAADRIAAMYRLSEHVSRDRILISSLVSMAIAAGANEEVTALVASGRLTGEARDTIAGAISRFDQADPFGTRRSVGGEREITVNWIRTNFTGPHAGKNLMDQYGAALQGDRPGVGRVISAMDERRLAEALDQLSTYYDAGLAAWDRPDAVAHLDTLAEQAAAKFGPLADMIAPALGRARRSDFEAQAALQAAGDALRNAKVGR